MILHLLLFTAFVLWYADFEAKDDAQEIAAHLTIDHTHQWIERAVAFFCAWFITWIICSLPSTWPTLIGHAFLFSAVFRLRLNKRRGKHWAYIAPWSNVYDRVWYAIVWYTKVSWLHQYRKRMLGWAIVYPFTNAACAYERWAYGVVLDSKTHIHQSGRLAYLTEITLFALCTAGAVVMQP